MSSRIVFSFAFCELVVSFALRIVFSRNYPFPLVGKFHESSQCRRTLPQRAKDMAKAKATRALHHISCHALPQRQHIHNLHGWHQHHHSGRNGLWMNTQALHNKLGMSPIKSAVLAVLLLHVVINLCGVNVSSYPEDSLRTSDARFVSSSCFARYS